MEDAQVALVPSQVDPALFRRLDHRAIRLVIVGTAGEPAIVDERGQVTEEDGDVGRLAGLVAVRDVEEVVPPLVGALELAGRPAGPAGPAGARGRPGAGAARSSPVKPKSRVNRSNTRQASDNPRGPTCSG